MRESLARLVRGILVLAGLAAVVTYVWAGRFTYHFYEDSRSGPDMYLISLPGQTMSPEITDAESLRTAFAAIEVMKYDWSGTPEVEIHRWWDGSQCTDVDRLPIPFEPECVGECKCFKIDPSEGHGYFVAVDYHGSVALTGAQGPLAIDHTSVGPQLIALPFNTPLEDASDLRADIWSQTGSYVAVGRFLTFARGFAIYTGSTGADFLLTPAEGYWVSGTAETYIPEIPPLVNDTHAVYPITGEVSTPGFAWALYEDSQSPPLCENPTESLAGLSTAEEIADILASQISSCPGFEATSSVGVTLLVEGPPHTIHVGTDEANCSVDTHGCNFNPLIRLGHCEQLPQQTAGWWPGNDSIIDLIGGNDASLTNGAGFAPGWVLQAFECDGVDDRVVVADPLDGSLDFGPGDAFTLEAWIRTMMTEEAELIQKRQDPVLPDTQMYQMSLLADGFVACEINDGSNSIRLSGVTPINDGRFHHVACVRNIDQGELILFVDGSEDARMPDTTLGSLESSSDLVLCGSGSPLMRSFEGIVDEVRIFRRALSSCEILSTYQVGSAGACSRDRDGDSIADYEDNCPTVNNPAQMDTDFDTAGDGCDCAPQNSGVLTAGESHGLRFMDKTTATWCSVEFTAGVDTIFDVVQGLIDELPVGTGSSEICLVSDTTETGFADSTPLDPGQGFWYLVRGKNACGDGDFGPDGYGRTRTSAACP